MAYLNNMKIGWIGFVYQPPKEMTEPMDKLFWQLDKAKEFGCEVLQPVAPVPTDDASVEKLLKKMKECNVEYEMQCPRGVFELTSDHAAEAEKQLLAGIELAKKYGAKIMRTGYGQLKMETSRYSKIPGKTGKEQLATITASLKKAAPIFEEHKMYFAQENHVDFTGKELAALYAEINSPYMGIALDTANGFAVMSEATEDSLAMVPWAITSHIKDAKVIDKTQDGTYYPLIPVGCGLGEGVIDIPGIIKAIAEKSRYPEGFHLILEQSWFGFAPGMDYSQIYRDTMEKSLDYLKKLITVK